MEKFAVEYIPGGATQNTVRVAQVSAFFKKSTFILAKCFPCKL